LFSAIVFVFFKLTNKVIMKFIASNTIQFSLFFGLFLCLPILSVGQESLPNGREANQQPIVTTPAQKNATASKSAAEGDVPMTTQTGYPVDLDEPRDMEDKQTNEAGQEQHEIQRLASELTLLRQAVDRLRLFNEQLVVENARLKGSIETCCESERTGNGNRPMLFQNLPNPGRESVQIRYSLPPSLRRAEIRILSPQGVVLIARQNLEPGQHSVEIDTRNLEAGFYVYSLYSDDEILDSRIMLIQ